MIPNLRRWQAKIQVAPALEGRSAFVYRVVQRGHIVPEGEREHITRVVVDLSLVRVGHQWRNTEVYRTIVRRTIPQDVAVKRNLPQPTVCPLRPAELQAGDELVCRTVVEDRDLHVPTRLREVRDFQFAGGWRWQAKIQVAPALEGSSAFVYRVVQRGHIVLEGEREHITRVVVDLSLVRVGHQWRNTEVYRTIRCRTIPQDVAVKLNLRQPAVYPLRPAELQVADELVCRTVVEDRDLHVPTRDREVRDFQFAGPGCRRRCWLWGRCWGGSRRKRCRSCRGRGKRCCSRRGRGKRCCSCRGGCRREGRSRRSSGRSRRNCAVNERGALVYAGDSRVEGTLNIGIPNDGYERGVCTLYA